MKKNKNFGKPRNDLTGYIFDKITVIGFSHRDEHGRYYWLCDCGCGKQKVMRGDVLIRSNIKLGKSCGCNCSLNMWAGHEEISGSYWWNFRKQALKKRKFQITIEQAWELFLKQDRKCALTGEVLTFTRYYTRDGRKFQTASLDRIDNNKDYTIDNIQWINKDINWLKGTFTMEELIILCRKITKFQEQKQREQYEDYTI